MNGSLKILSIPGGRRRSSYNSAGLFGTVRAQYHLDQSSITLNSLPANPSEITSGNGSEVLDDQETLERRNKSKI